MYDIEQVKEMILNGGKWRSVKIVKKSMYVSYETEFTNDMITFIM